MTTMEPHIRSFVSEDWPQVARIYREGIATGDATFETDVPTWEAWDDSHLEECRLVAETDGGIVGWFALSPVSDRCTYEGVAEVSIYVDASARGGGIGRALLQRGISTSEEAGLWTLQAGIFPENKASIRLHEGAGFRMVGTREKLGRLGGRWRDVSLLERRSEAVGSD